MVIKKWGAFTQERSVLFVETSAKSCAPFLPFYEINKAARGVLLDLIEFSTAINFDKYQLAKNNVIFNRYAAIFAYESEIINYSLYKTPEELYSRNSMKSIPDTKCLKRNYSIDEISTADTEESFIDGINEDDVEKCNMDDNERIRNKLVRVTILYILWFFALVSVTFFIIYLA